MRKAVLYCDVLCSIADGRAGSGMRWVSFCACCIVPGGTKWLELGSVVMCCAVLCCDVL